ncbi:MAG TPA: DUF2169 domain-containing protein, partial [Minicystis sp.]|nr:DUF2169 domain-containing protein [Minicystis sp.]
MSASVLAADAAIAAGATSVHALAYRFRGALRVTVVAKASFAFAPEAPMPRAAPQPIFRSEVHHRDNPTRSVRFTSDLAPYLGRADVVLTGFAYAPPGARSETVPVRLGLFDGARAVLDKTVLVRQKGGVHELPLVFERAYGGQGFPDNPLGVGVLDNGEA